MKVQDTLLMFDDPCGLTLIRHLVVVDSMNRLATCVVNYLNLVEFGLLCRVAGVITRKDLMGFSLEERLHSYEDRRRREQVDVKTGGSRVTTPVEMGEVGSEGLDF